MGLVSAVVALPLPAPSGAYCHQTSASATHYDDNHHDDQPHLDHDPDEALGDRLMALLAAPLPPDPPPIDHNHPPPPPGLNVVLSPPPPSPPVRPPPLLHHHSSSPQDLPITTTTTTTTTGGGPAPLQEPAHVSLDRISCILPATPTDFSPLNAVPSSPDAGHRAGHQQHHHHMFLSSCDLVCRSYPYINRIFFYATPPASASASADAAVAEYNGHVASLKDSLARTLVHFYPLAGRFTTDAGGRLSVACNDEGVEFVEACVRDLPFNRLKDAGFQYSNLFWKLARRTELLRSDYLDQPILSVQITRFPADHGGFSVGVSMSHAVADAQSFYDFMKCWADTCRSVAMSVPPLHVRPSLSVDSLSNSFDETLSYMMRRVKDISLMSKRCRQPQQQLVAEEKRGGAMQEYGEKFLSVMEGQREEEKLFSALEEQQQKRGEKMMEEMVSSNTQGRSRGGSRPTNQSAVAAATAARTQAPIMEKQKEQEEKREARKDLVQRVFSFNEEKLKKIKELAGAGGGPKETYTTFESFCAHWWRALIRARRLPEEQAVCLLIPINCRQRFLKLPKGYFGNALDGALVKQSAGALCRARLPEIAAQIHRAITAVTEGSFRDYILEAERRRNAIPHFDRTGLFHVVDSPKYPVYATDFGWGAPSAVRAEGFRFGAEVQILAGALGGYDMFCALDADSMAALMDDSSFVLTDMDSYH